MYRVVASGPSGSVEKELTLIVSSEGGEVGEGVDFAPTTVTQFGEFVTHLHANNNKQFGVYYRVGPSGSLEFMCMSLIPIAPHTHTHTPSHLHTLTGPEQQRG